MIMKRIYIFILFFICSNIGNAQTYVTIPDANFLNYLKANYPACMNDNKMDIECSAIKNATSINVNGLSISNLSGIEYFTNLQTLVRSENQLTNLPQLP